MRKIILLFLLLCGGLLNAQISLSEIQDTVGKGYVPITDYDPALATYIQKYMLLQDYLEDSISWASVPVGLHDAVTLAGSYDYITLSGQVITRNQIDLTTDVTGLLPYASLSGAPTLLSQFTDDLGHVEESTTVTDLANGLDIYLSTYDITVSPDFVELTTETTIDDTDYIIMHDATTPNDGKITYANLLADIVSDASLDLTQVLTNGNDAGGLDAMNFAEVEAEEFIGDLRGAVLFKAQAGETLAKGDVVYVSGISGNTTIVSKADADDAAKMPAFGVAAAAASSPNPVDIYTFGTLSNLNTSGFTLGDILYVSTTAGQLTATPPTGESALIQNIAKVTRVHASSGSIKISGAGRTNATPNLNTGRLFVGNASNQAVADGTIYVDIANSRVGIGTSSPTTRTHIYDATLDLPLLVESGDAAARIAFKDNTTTINPSVGALANNLNWYVENVAEMVLRPTGLDLTTVPTENTSDILTWGSTGIISKTTKASIIEDAGYWDRTGTTISEANSGDDLNFDSNTLFVDASANRVGIGLSNPSQKLEVAGNVFTSNNGTSNYFRAYHSDGSYANLTGYGIELSRSASYIRPTASGTKDLFIGSSILQWDEIDLYYDNNISFFYNGNLLMNLIGDLSLFDSGSNEDIRLNPNGNSYIMNNLGIGTSSPLESLHTTGSIMAQAGDMLKRYVSGWVTPTHDIVYTSYSPNFAAGGADYSYLKAAGNSTVNHGMIYVADSEFGIGQSNIEQGGLTTGLDNYFIYGNNTGVGIGTTSPSAKLDVIGEFQLVNSSVGVNKVLIDSDGSGNTTFVDLSSLVGGTDDQTLQEVTDEGSTTNNNMSIVSSGNGKFTIESNFPNSTSTGLTIDNTGDGSIARLTFSKDGVNRGLMSYIHNSSGAAEYFNFNVSGLPQLRIRYGNVEFPQIATDNTENTIAVIDGNNYIKTKEASQFNLTDFTDDIGVGYWDRTSTNTYLANSGDNVGIGTTSPSKQLTIQSTGNAESLIETTIDALAATTLKNADAQWRIGVESFDDGLIFRQLDAGYTVGEALKLGANLDVRVYNNLRVDAMTQDDTESQVVVWDSGTNNLRWRDVSTIGDGDGIYDGSGSLSSSTTVTINGYGIDFVGSSDEFSINSFGQTSWTEGSNSSSIFQSGTAFYIQNSTSLGSIQLRTGSPLSTALYVKWDGNIGIGTLNPDELLVVEGANSEIVINDTSNSPELSFENSGATSGSITMTSNQHMRFLTGGTSEQMRITNTGLVGINITSPNAHLDVGGRIESTSHIVSGVGSGGVAMTINDGKGNANLTFNHTAGVPEQAGAAARIEVNTDATTNAYMHFELKENNATSSINLVNALTLFQDNANSTTSAYAAVNDATPNHPFTVTWNGSQYFRVETDGDLSLAHNGGGTVSIGHISPDATKVLDVEGDSEFNGDVEWEDGGLGRIHKTATTTSTGAPVEITTYDSGSALDVGAAVTVTESTGVIEVNFTGYYRVSFTATMKGTDATNEGEVRLRINDTIITEHLADEIYHEGLNPMSHGVSFIMLLTAGDDLSLYVDRVTGAGNTEASYVSLNVERIFGYD